MIYTYKRRNFKMFIFIIISVILMLLLILFSLTKAFSTNSNEEISNIQEVGENGICHNIISKVDNLIIKEDSNKLVNDIQIQKNIAISKINIIKEIKNKPKEETHKKTEFGSNVAFIGDSRTQAFLMYAGLKDVVDYTNIGLMVDTAVTKKFITNNKGEKITILEDLKNKNIDTVYIMLGINELGWVYSSIFINAYEELIDRIKEIKPNCEIIVQSIIPVTKTKSNSDSIYNNQRISEYNSLIKEMTNRKNIKYIDLIPALTDEYGNLPENASTDGIHLNKKYCLKWLECLENN